MTMSGNVSQTKAKDLVKAHSVKAGRTEAEGARLRGRELRGRLTAFPFARIQTPGEASTCSKKSSCPSEPEITAPPCTTVSRYLILNPGAPPFTTRQT